ncbi:MAG: nitroreductase family protein [Pseudomonadota bacterium]
MNDPAQKGVADVIRARRTDKILVDPAAPLAPEGPSRATLDAWLETAAAAPMHYPSHLSHRSETSALPSPAPYRAYKLDAAGCRALLGWLQDEKIETGKIADMLAGAAALLQVTWTPEPPLAPDADRAKGEERERMNMEHVAAGGAVIQNLLLLATEAGWRSYWSSGGVLREKAVFERLGMPESQVLLGAVFLFPPEIGSARVMPGKWRGKQGAVADWSVWRDL